MIDLAYNSSSLYVIVSSFKKLFFLMPSLPPIEGYWGAVSKSTITIASSVDWCEKNYAQSMFIAEFFNVNSVNIIIIECFFNSNRHRWNWQLDFARRTMHV
jgi:hypothetical protein